MSLNLEERRQEVYTKIPSRMDEYKDKFTDINSNVTLDDLLNAFSLFLKREELKQPVNTKVTRKEYSVEERCLSIRKKLKQCSGKIKFIDLFESISKSYVVVTFLLRILNKLKMEKCFNSKKNKEDILKNEW